MIHELKTWPEYFQAVKSGDKTFELRKDDRPYSVGDILVLREWDPDVAGVEWTRGAIGNPDAAYTGAVCRCRVIYTMRGGPWLTPGYVALGISLLEAEQ